MSISTSEFIQIASFNHTLDPPLQLFEAELRSENIRYYIGDGVTIEIDPLLTNALGGAKIMVHKNDAVRARQMYLAFQERHGIATGETKHGSTAVWILVALIVLILFGVIRTAMSLD